MSKKIFIIGNSAKEYALAKKLAISNQVFVAPGSDLINEFAKSVDIREDSTSELLEFAMENGIDLTIPVSKKSINTNIVELFNNNSQQIFAPALSSFETLFDKTSAKKMFYKLRIPTPRFGIFEKQNMAVDYIKKLKQPFVVKTNEPSSAVVLTSLQTAKNVLDSYFINKNQKVLIEDYIWGTPFSFYVITDGYKALPIGSSIQYKYSLEGDGGQLTSGMGACVPNYKLSLENEYYIMDSIVYPILEYLEANNSSYLGILGINGVLTEDGTIQILGLQPFMGDSDSNAVLELLDEDLVSIIESCLIGSFSDEVDFIAQKDLFATSLVLKARNKSADKAIVAGLDNLDEELLKTFSPFIRKNKYFEYEMDPNSIIVLTSLARTASSAIKKLYNETEELETTGIYYRKDICKPNRELV